MFLNIWKLGIIFLKSMKNDIDIIPKNKAQEYIVFLSEKKHFIANHIDTRDELLEDDYQAFIGGGLAC